EILDGRIEILLNHGIHAMDLVDEEDRPLLEVRQQPGQIAPPLEHRAGRLRHGHAHLGGKDRREGGLAETRRAVEEDVVERLAASARGLHRDPKLLAQRFLPDELVELLRTEARVEIPLAPQRLGIGDSLVLRWRRRRDAGTAPGRGTAARGRSAAQWSARTRTRHHFTPCWSARRTRASTVACDPSSWSAPCTALMAPFRVKPSATSAAAASPATPTWSAPGDPKAAGREPVVVAPGANFSRSSTTSRCASFFPTPGRVTRKS